MLAVALPGLVAAVAMDPTGLADALVVRLRVPARPAYSVLAGLRLLPLLADEWAVLGRASRARGLGGSGIRARARQFASMTFRLLVAALRRGGRLAIALDARGLRPDAPAHDRPAGPLVVAGHRRARRGRGRAGRRAVDPALTGSRRPCGAAGGDRWNHRPMTEQQTQ